MFWLIDGRSLDFLLFFNSNMPYILKRREYFLCQHDRIMSTYHRPAKNNGWGGSKTKKSGDFVIQKCYAYQTLSLLEGSNTQFTHVNPS
jgi:hypothetical protein